MKTCHNCGSINPDVANYCLDCGIALTPKSTVGGSKEGVPVTIAPRNRVPNTIDSVNPVFSSKSPIPDTIESQQPPAIANPKPSIPDTIESQQPPAIANPKPSIPDTIESQKPNTIDPQEFKALYQSIHNQQRKADIMFVLDCTGSMGGEIDAIRDAITDFADTIESQAVRVRVGLIEFRDRLIKEEHRALLFDGQPFTSDPTAFRQEISKLKAHGGGDEPESSLDAIMLALRQPFAPDSDRVIVLVTDAPPHIPDLETQNIEEIVQKMGEVGIGQFYMVMRTQDPRSQVYLKLLGTGTRNLAFDIGKGEDFRERAEHFKRTLMALGKTISSATR